MKKDKTIPANLLYNLSPLIWVNSSEEVKELCLQNYFLNFADLLKPFGKSTLEKVSIRNGSGMPKQHENFSIRFLEFDPSLPIPNAGVEDALQSRNVSDLIKNHALTLNLSKPDEDKDSKTIEFDIDEISLKTIDEYSPWFSIYRDTFFSYYRPLDYETFDHPVCWLMVTAISNPDPIGALTAMFERSNKVSLGSLVDPDILRYYILIYDPEKDNINEVQSIFERMKKTFGLHCDLLPIPTKSSSSPIGHISPTNNDKPSLWTPYRDTNQKPLLTPIHQLDPSGMRSGSRSGYPGQYFGSDELANIGDLVKKMTLEFIIPFLERKMHHMNEQVASSRRGFTGRLLNVSRRYFNTSRPNSPSPTGSIPNSYTYNSPEGQMRKLGDLAFMLRDFDLAQNTYEAVKKDFQSDKSWNFYSGAQMMVGLCLLLSDYELGQKIEIERYFDKSLAHFTSSKLMVAASKTCFLYYQMFIYLERYSDIPVLLNYLISEDSDLRSGLCLEQIACAYLSMLRPHQRRYAYYLTLAGSRYNRCNQREHAYSCYLRSHRAFQIGSPIELDDDQAIKVKKWDYIEDHISFSLGRQCSLLGQILPAIQHFLWLLNESEQNFQTQAVYLKEFLYAYDNYVKSTNHHLLLEPGYYLPIPEIDPIKISIELENPFDPSVLTKDNQIIWGDLESQAFGRDMTSDLKTGLVKNSKSIQTEENLSLVEEPLLIKLVIANPLQLSLNLSNLKLDCSYEGEGEGEVESTVAEEPFELSEVDDFILGGLKKVELSYKLIPKISGKIKIKGLFFAISESAASYKSFDTGPNTKTQSSNKKNNLVINAVTKMPQLQVKFLNPPETILSGEAIKTEIELTNTGSQTCSKIWIKLSHSTFFSFKSDSIDLESYPLSSIVEINNKVPDPTTIELNLTKFSTNGLNPGESIELPLYIRGDRIGNHNFYLLFYYKAEQKALYRTTRTILPLNVQPSLKINAFTRPSTLGLDQFILGVEVENVHSELEFIINQLSTCSLNWKVTPINIKSNANKENLSQINKLELNNKGNLILYFNIKRINNITPKLLSETDELKGGSINWKSPEAHLAKSLQDLILDAKKFNEIEPVQITYSDIPLHGRVSSISQNPTNSLYFASRAQYYKSNLMPHSKFITNLQRDSIFPLFMSNDIDMSLHWEVKGSNSTIRKGHHFIIGINFSIPQSPLLDVIPSEDSFGKSPQQLKAVRALFESTAIEKSKLINHLLNFPKFSNELNIKVSSSCQDVVKNDFSKNPCISLPVKFLITNCSWNRFTKIHLILISPATSETRPQSTALEEFDPNTMELFNQKNPQSLHFQWNGKISHEFILPPNETIELNCSTFITYPGIYNLNSWQLRAQIIENEGNQVQTITQVLKQFGQNSKLISLDHSYLHSPSSSLLCKIIDSDGEGIDLRV